MDSKQFEQVIQKIDPRFTIVDNPNRPGLSNIFFEGVNYDLPVVSTKETKEEVDFNHRYEFPNGMSARLWSQKEITDRLEAFIKNVDEIKKDYE